MVRLTNKDQVPWLCSMSEEDLTEDYSGMSKQKIKAEQECTKCAVCLQPCIQPVQLLCKHIFCYPCVNSATHQSERCAMCKQEIPPNYLDSPYLIAAEKSTIAFEGPYQYFYKGESGWWKYDERTGTEIEAAYKVKKYQSILRLVSGTSELKTGCHYSYVLKLSYSRKPVVFYSDSNDSIINIRCKIQDKFAEPPEPELLSSICCHHLPQRLQTAGDERQQLQAVTEMCQLLVTGNEDTLFRFPVRKVVPLLINLLSMEHNSDMLQATQCMDVAEQSLTALEILSRRHSKAILHSRGISACLMYLDFFSINAQRAALSITANCCQNLVPDEFNLIQDFLPLLSARLTHQDKKSVESVCLAFSRLIDCFQNDPKCLMEIAGHGLLTNIQQLLVVTPPVISSGTFLTVIRILAVMSASCSELAVLLLKQNIVETLEYVLTESSGSTGDTKVQSRTPQELLELTILIRELVRRLPTDGIFSVDSPIMKPNSMICCDDDIWCPYTGVDSKTMQLVSESARKLSKQAPLFGHIIIKTVSNVIIYEDVEKYFTGRYKFKHLGKEMCLQLNSNDTLNELKIKIQDKIGTPPDYTCEIFKVPALCHLTGLHHGRQRKELKRKIIFNDEENYKPLQKKALFSNEVPIPEFVLKDMHLPHFKITSWNINGIQSWFKRGDSNFLYAYNPDVICLQDTKCLIDKIPENMRNLKGYHSYWSSGTSNGGIGVMSKEEPLNIKYGLGRKEHDNEGRVITAEYDKFYLVNVYVPNAGRKLVRLDYRMKWDADFRKYLKKLDSTKPVIVCGDMNVAHKPSDLAKSKENKRTAGFTEEERNGFSSMLADGYIDVFRHLYPQKISYTFWHAMKNARERNIGWRKDYFLVSSRCLEYVNDCIIHSEILGSDHCPISLLLD